MKNYNNCNHTKNKKIKIQKLIKLTKTAFGSLSTRRIGTVEKVVVFDRSSA